MTARIAVLGWGSLLWDVQPTFDDQHDDWRADGPSLLLEFSRISDKRKGALTLVIDSLHGQSCVVSYALSKRLELDDAICDLRTREGTTVQNIGVISADGTIKRCRDEQTQNAITEWIRSHKCTHVIWTDLTSNFSKRRGKDFSIHEASEHIQSLPADGKSMAAEYVWRAPYFVDTPLRRTLQAAPWFKP